MDYTFAGIWKNILSFMLKEQPMKNGAGQDREQAEALCTRFSSIVATKGLGK